MAVPLFGVGCFLLRVIRHSFGVFPREFKRNKKGNQTRYLSRTCRPICWHHVLLTNSVPRHSISLVIIERTLDEYNILNIALHLLIFSLDLWCPTFQSIEISTRINLQILNSWQCWQDWAMSERSTKLKKDISRNLKIEIISERRR